MAAGPYCLYLGRKSHGIDRFRDHIDSAEFFEAGDLFGLAHPSIDCFTGQVVQALRERRIMGAALDVFDREPPPPDYPLMALGNAILTPHLAWYSEDSGIRIRELVLLEIERALAGLPPRYIANSVTAPRIPKGVSQ